MTRDDAVKKAEECFQFNVPGQVWFFTPLRLVAALENLGLLKFEEPLESRQSPTYKAYEALFEHIPTLDFQTFRALLRGAELEVTARTPQVNEVPHD